MRSAIVPIFSLCVSAKSSSSGRRAMVPSSFMISTITAEDRVRRAAPDPACLGVSGAREHAAGLRHHREDVSGLAQSSGRASGATAVITVCARSCAEMPVVTPSAASIESVKLVRCSRCLADHQRQAQLPAAFLGQREADQAAPERAMKLMSSGRTFCAAMMRSPSFSRSSSSMITTMRPGGDIGEDLLDGVEP